MQHSTTASYSETAHAAVWGTWASRTDEPAQDNVEKTMRYLLAIAITLATFGTAHAQVPAQLHGHWCQDMNAMMKLAKASGNGNDLSVLVYDRKRGKRCPVEDSNDDNSIRISAGRFQWSGFGCTVAQFRDLVRGWQVQLKCAPKRKGVAPPWVDEYSIQLVNGQMRMTSLR